MWKKLTEQSTRDHTRSVYFNMDRVDRVYSNGIGCRLAIGTNLYDVTEKLEAVLDIPETVVITDKDEPVERSSGNEDGRVANPASKSDS
jgi:hypothetical protein